MALCKLLLKRPDLLLLDEPTNHLDTESVSWIEDFLKAFSGTVVAITHDRCDAVMVSRRGWTHHGDFRCVGAWWRLLTSAFRRRVERGWFCKLNSL